MSRAACLRMAALVCALILAIETPLSAWADDNSDERAAFAAGMALQREGDYPAAARAFERALELAPRVFGPEHKNTAVVLFNLANIRGHGPVRAGRTALSTEPQDLHGAGSVRTTSTWPTA